MQYERKVYLLVRNDSIDYDEAAGFVCIANSAKEARDMGTDLHGDQSPDVWKLHTTRVSVIGHTNRPKGVVITDYRSG